MTLELVPWRGANVPVLARDEISRYNVAELLAKFRYSQQYLGAPTPVTTYGNRPAEPISSSFEGFVWGMLYADGPVAAVEAYRLRVFGQAPLLYQEMKDGRPGDLFDDDRLDRLRTPWPGGNLGDLMKRALVYGDFAGNAFIVDLDDELVLLRPDWVEIVLSKRMVRGGQVGWRQVGIVYYEGGLGVGDGVAFLPGEYCHFVPGLPDPLATFRGMSWLTPLVREVQADKSAGDHKVAFFENAASPNLAVSLPKEITPAQFKEFVDKMDSEHRGATQAYKTLYTAGGADVTVIGANMQQMDFSSVQGKGETRIANAGGVSPALLSFSEGMQGSSLNAGNFVPAKRNFVDTTMRDLWTNWAGSIQKMDAFAPPEDRKSRLSYDPRDIPFLRDDEQDIAQRQQTQASTISSLITAGYKPDSAQTFVVTDDPMTLEHTGLTSVQLMPPGSQDADGDGVADAEEQAAEDYEAALDEFRSELVWRDEILRKFDPDQPRAAWVGGVGGKWAASGVLRDALNLAGRIDLDPGEEFVGSDKIKSDYASVRLAATERSGRRLVRLGLGDGVFGGREDEGGPWRGRDTAAEENARRAPLLAEYLALQSGEGDMTPAEQARFDALDEMDLNEVQPSGHTARLDESGASRLRTALATDLDKALQIKAAEDARFAEIDRLEAQREPLRAMTRKWTDAEDARWDELTAKIEALEAADPYPNIEDLPSFEGSVPAEWADVHYRIEYFDGEVGATIGAVPHDSHLDLSDLSGNNEAASLDSPEIQRLIGLLDRSLSRDDATRSYIERRDYYDVRDFRGRFRKISDRVGHALNEWLKGDGDADDPLEEFSRENLRLAAKEFGITPRRGASSDELKLALLKDARARFRGESDMAGARKPVRMTLQSAKYRDLDVGVYRDGNKVSLYRLSPTSETRGTRIASFDDLAGLEAWGRDNGEPQVADWAASERAPVKKAAPRKVPAKKPAPRKAAESVPAKATSKPKREPLGDPADVDARLTRAKKGRDAVKATKVGYVGEPWESGAISGLTGVTDRKARQISDAFGAYQTEDFAPVNEALRGVDPDAIDQRHGFGAAAKAMDRVSLLDAAFDQAALDESVVLHRGVGTGGEIFGADLDREDLAGFSWQDAGYASTTASPDVATRFARDGGPLLRIVAPKGTRAVSISSNDNDDQEVVLARGASFRVVRDNGWREVTQATTGQRIRVRDLDVEIVPAAAPSPAKSTPRPRRQPLGDPAAKLSSLRALGDVEAVRDDLDLLLLDDLKTLAKAAGVATSGRKRDVADRIAAKVHTADAPDPEQSARDRQSRLDTVRTAAEALVDLDTMAHNGGSEKALRQRVDTRVRMGALSEDEGARLRDLADNPAGFRAAVADILSSRGATTHHTTGDTVPFDPSTMRAQGDRPDRGTPVQVVSPGAMLTEDDGTVVTLAPTVVMDVPTPDVPRIRPSGLPTDRKLYSGDFDDLAGRLVGKSEEQIVELIADLNASELARLARKWEGPRRTRSTLSTAQGRRGGLRIPDGLSLDERRRWFANWLANQRTAWRSADIDLDDAPTEEDEVSRAGDDEPEVDDVSDDDDDFDPEIDYHVSCIDWGDDEAERAEVGEDDDIVRAMDRNQLKHYWTKGKGLAKWLGHPRPWTALYRHLRKYVGAERAKRMAAQWVHDVTGNWPGSDAHRVATGHKPRGSRIGPG